MRRKHGVPVNLRVSRKPLFGRVFYVFINVHHDTKVYLFTFWKYLIFVTY